MAPDQASIGALSHYNADYAEFLLCLRQARKDAGLRQSDVATRMGRVQSWVSKIESGELRVDFVEMVYLSRIYGKVLADFASSERR